MNVYVLNSKKKPLMPCSPCKAKHLLRNRKAKVVSKTPFTIQMIEFGGGNTQSCAPIRALSFSVNERHTS